MAASPLSRETAPAPGKGPTQILNIHRLPEKKVPPGAVYVGRNPQYGGSIFGNPFSSLGPGESRARFHVPGEEVMARHELWARAKLKEDAFGRALDDLYGRDLVCHCAQPNGSKRCHGETYWRMTLDRVWKSRLAEMAMVMDKPRGVALLALAGTVAQAAEDTAVRRGLAPLFRIGVLLNGTMADERPKFLVAMLDPSGDHSVEPPAEFLESFKTDWRAETVAALRRNGLARDGLALSPVLRTVSASQFQKAVPQGSGARLVELPAWGWRRINGVPLEGNPATLGIVGSAGRNSDSPLVTRELYDRIVEDVAGHLVDVGTHGTPVVVSGGAAFIDHAAVTLFLSGRIGALKLFLPAEFIDGRFKETRDGEIANYWHDIFRQSTGVPSLLELELAIARGAEVEVIPGMAARNGGIARAVRYILAYTFGPHGKQGNDAEPHWLTPEDPGFRSAAAAGLKKGGTEGTWNMAVGPNIQAKKHVNLYSIRREIEREKAEAAEAARPAQMGLEL